MESKGPRFFFPGSICTYLYIRCGPLLRMPFMVSSWWSLLGLPAATWCNFPILPYTFSVSGGYGMKPMFIKGRQTWQLLLMADVENISLFIYSFVFYIPGGARFFPLTVLYCVLYELVWDRNIHEHPKSIHFIGAMLKNFIVLGMVILLAMRILAVGMTILH